MFNYINSYLHFTENNANQNVISENVNGITRQYFLFKQKPTNIPRYNRHHHHHIKYVIFRERTYYGNRAIFSNRSVKQKSDDDSILISKKFHHIKQNRNYSIHNVVNNLEDFTFFVDRDIIIKESKYISLKTKGIRINKKNIKDLIIYKFDNIIINSQNEALIKAFTGGFKLITFKIQHKENKLIYPIIKSNSNNRNISDLLCITKWTNDSYIKIKYHLTISNIPNLNYTQNFMLCVKTFVDKDTLDYYVTNTKNIPKHLIDVFLDKQNSVVKNSIRALYDNEALESNQIESNQIESNQIESNQIEGNQIEINMIENKIKHRICYDLNGNINLNIPIAKNILSNPKRNSSDGRILAGFCRSSLEKPMSSIDDIGFQRIKDKKIGKLEKLEIETKDFLNINLFNYQKNNILWMTNLENSVRSKCTKLSIGKTDDCNILKFPNYETVYLTPENKLRNYKTLFDNGRIEKYRIRGGILSDEVGLGKTVCAIGLILNRRYQDDTWYKETMGKNLIICPSRLCQQWKFEIDKYLKSENINLKVVVLSVFKDIKKNTRQDIIGADIVIVSFFMFSNQNYQNSIESKFNPSQNKNFPDRDLRKIKWYRIIIDEAHEILNVGISLPKNLINNKAYDKSKLKNLYARERSIRDFILEIRGKYKWCLTATPLAVPLNNFEGIFTFLTQKTHNNMLYNLGQDQLTDIKEKYFRKNTKESVKQELSVPKIVEEIELLEFTSTERGIYNCAVRAAESSNTTRRLFHLCTHIQVSEEENQILNNDPNCILSLKQINSIMSKHYESKIKIHQKKIRIYQQEKDKLTQTIPIIKDFRKFLNNQIKDLYLRINNSQIKIDNYQDLQLQQNDENDENDENEIIPTDLEQEDNQDNRICICSLEELVTYFPNKLPLNEIQFIRKLEDKIQTIYAISCLLKIGITHSQILKILTQQKEEIILNIPRDRIMINICNNLLYNLSLFTKKKRPRIKRLEDLIENDNQDIKILNNQLKLFSNDTFIKDSVKEPCNICFDSFDEIVITKCRHIFCGSCVNILFSNKTSIKCPMCRTALSKTDTHKTTVEKINEESDSESDNDENEQKDNSVVQDDPNDEINKFGTKLAYLIKYLRNLISISDARIIIFSQYDKMLRMIGKVLDEFFIGHVYCKGNINIINQNIMKFKTDPLIKVIMLSSETCASGNNLTEASHIVFVDVLNTNKTRAIAIENQAIGRAVRLGQQKNVIVKRLIMKNTIEEEYYNKNKYDVNDPNLIG